MNVFLYPVLSATQLFASQPLDVFEGWSEVGNATRTRCHSNTLLLSLYHCRYLVVAFSLSPSHLVVTISSRCRPHGVTISLSSSRCRHLIIAISLSPSCCYHLVVAISI